MRQQLDKPPSSTKAVRAEVGVGGGEGERGGISASNVIILINLCHGRQQLCVINAPDSRSPGAQREGGVGVTQFQSESERTSQRPRE